MKHIGDLLDGLDVNADLDDRDLVASAVVVMTVLEPESSEPRIVLASNNGLSWIEQAGMLRLAERIASDLPEPQTDDD